MLLLPLLLYLGDIGTLPASCRGVGGLQSSVNMRGRKSGAIASGHIAGGKQQRWAGERVLGVQQGASRLLRLRGGMILEPWEREAFANSTAYAPETLNITEDCVEDWDKDKEDAWTAMCEKELEEHWQQLRENRTRDIETGDVGCNYVADDEYMVRGVDGNIYKFRYDPKPYSSLGPNVEPRRMPLAVDKVNPACLDEIVADLEERDQERLREERELMEETERQIALVEALSWYNGSSRLEFQNGKALWWRSLNKSDEEVDDGHSESQSIEETTSSEQYPDLLDDYVVPTVLYRPNESSPAYAEGRQVPEPDFSQYNNDAHRSLRLDNTSFDTNAGFSWNSLGEELRSCVWRGKTEFVPELLALGADPNYLTIFGGWRPLHYAAWNDRPKIALQLIEAGAWKDVQNDDGQTALHLAAARGSIACIQTLIEAGCDANIRHGDGLLPLEVAHKMMICSDYSMSLKIKDAVLLLIGATSDAEARDAALEDAHDRWEPMEGFAS